MSVEIMVNGSPVVVDDDRRSLLDVLRGQCGTTSVKDGCAPQGQCGCCTVLVDGAARVSCVTPVRRVAGRSIITLEGLSESEQSTWADALVTTGGSQCGFCTPGIICRLAALEEIDDAAKVDHALAAHLCRCTGWQTVIEAISVKGRKRTFDASAAAKRATLEGASPQQVGPEVALGRGGFSADTAPDDALVALMKADGSWVVAESVGEARTIAGRVQGRRSTAVARSPLEVPEGIWDRTLRTTWVDPGHLEVEASWCAPDADPSSLLANGGGFGAKAESGLGEVARRLAAEHDRPVLCMLTREDSLQTGRKRPPVAAGIRADGTGEIRVVRTAGITEAIHAMAPLLNVVEVDVAGPPTSATIRGAGWVEAAVLISSLHEGPDVIETPGGARCTASVDDTGIHVQVDAGHTLDHVTLRSYCIGAAHMAYSWVTSESLAVDENGEVQDLTIRSLGILRAADTPAIIVDIIDSDTESVNGSDAVFAAVAAATWRAHGFKQDWPTT